MADENFDELVREFGSKVRKTQDANNAAITRIAEQHNLNHTVASVERIKAIDRLEDASRNMRAAMAEMIEATEALKAIDVNANEAAMQLHTDILYLRKVNEPTEKTKITALRAVSNE